MRQGGGSKKHLIALLSGAYLLARRGLKCLTQACGSSAVETFVILYYHSVPSEKRASFSRQMDILARCANVVPADWRGSPVGRPCVAITFDDAFTSVIDNALPELAMRGFPCTIFAPSGILGRHPDWAMEEDLDRGELVADAETLRKIHGPLVNIGSHTVTHPRLSQLDKERARAEIHDSRVALEEIVGTPIDLLAFPYGDYNGAIIELCRSDDGYKHVFTISPNPVPAGDSSLKRGRVSVSPDDGEFEFFLKISGAYAWRSAASVLKRRLATLTGAAHS
jgi:peptidoglycan/xylan/chitin deacetylase (PgdA/CDA1 family)